MLDYLVEWWRAEEPARNEVQIVKIAADGPLRGTFVMSYQGEATDTLPYDIAEEDLEAALESHPTLRDLQVFLFFSSLSHFLSSLILLFFLFF